MYFINTAETLIMKKTIEGIKGGNISKCNLTYSPPEKGQLLS